jgi:hypothetical protein
VFSNVIEPAFYFGFVWVCLDLSKQLLAASANRGHGIAQQIASHFVVINFKGAIGQALANFFDQLNV